MPEDLQSILGDPTLFNNSSDITTKEILKRYGDMGQNGGPKHQVETTDPAAAGKAKDGTQRPVAPVVTRVDTDPSQAHAWQKESSVRHIQDALVQSQTGGSHPNIPPHSQWHGQTDLEHPSPAYHHRNGNGNGTPDSQEGSSSRQYRNSGWGRPNGSVGVTGAS